MKLEYTIDYPFQMIFEEYKIWQAGCRILKGHQDDSGCVDYDFECDGIGSRILTEVETVKMPGKFQDRIVFIKQYIDPDGKKSGKSVHVATMNKFNNMKDGFIPRRDKLIYLKSTGCDICYNADGKLN